MASTSYPVAEEKRIGRSDEVLMEQVAGGPVATAFGLATKWRGRNETTRYDRTPCG
jgi:hypothetical protein